MDERLKPKELRTIFTASMQGDYESAEKLQSTLKTRLLRNPQLASIPEVERAIPIGQALSTLGERMPQVLDPSSPQLSTRLNDLCKTVAREVIAGLNQDPFRRTIGDFIPEWETKIEEEILPILPESQLDVVNPMIWQNQSISEVASELNLEPVTIRQRLHRARIVIEPLLFEPVSVFRVSSKKSDRLSHAASLHYLESFKFLDLHYTDQPGIERYYKLRGFTG